MTVTIHTYRGNFKSTWMASGGFEPLRLVPKGKKIVLRLVTSKASALEDKDTLKRLIAEAANYVPLENLGLSPQCGFSSTHHGNVLTEDDQWRKLELILQVAREIGARLRNADFVKLGESFGLAGRRVSTPDQLKREVGEALSRDAPALIEVAIETGSEVSPWEFLMPPSRSCG